MRELGICQEEAFTAFRSDQIVAKWISKGKIDWLFGHRRPHRSIIWGIVVWTVSAQAPIKDGVKIATFIGIYV